MQALWTQGELKYCTYKKDRDVFYCTAKWHLSRPDFIKGFRGEYRRDIEGEAGWLIPVGYRQAFLQAVEEQCGTPARETRLERKPTIPIAAATIGEAAAIDFPPPPPEMLRAAEGLVARQHKIMPKSRVAQEPIRNSLTDYCSATNEVIDALTEEYGKLAVHEHVYKDQIHIVCHNKETALLRVETYTKNNDYKASLWLETEHGLICVLKKTSCP